jgi:hypothetical protein
MWDSIRKAALSLETSSGNVHTAIKKHRTCKNFYWAYIDNPNVVNDKLINIKELKYKRSRPRHVKRIIQYSIFNR